MNHLTIPFLSTDPNSPFPPIEGTLHEPNGLLAAGGDLSSTRLLNAYRHGIFPWFSEDQPILWWSPDPRLVFATDSVKLSSKFQHQLRKSRWTLRADTSFEKVITTCANIPRHDQPGTWITAEMIAAYVELHRLGHAHSIEIFDSNHLVGGIYGVAIGRMFFGESMFSAESGGSKAALAGLAHLLHQWGWPLIDAQVENAHLLFLGGLRMPRSVFLCKVAELTNKTGFTGNWADSVGDRPLSELFNPDFPLER